MEMTSAYMGTSELARGKRLSYREATMVIAVTRGRRGVPAEGLGLEDRHRLRFRHRLRSRLRPWLLS